MNKRAFWSRCATLEIRCGAWKTILERFQLIKKEKFKFLYNFVEKNVKVTQKTDLFLTFMNKKTDFSPVTQSNMGNVMKTSLYELQNNHLHKPKLNHMKHLIKKTDFLKKKYHFHTYFLQKNTYPDQSPDFKT